jgi:hypothetical protein
MVTFDGPWSDSDAAIVHDAVTRAEDRLRKVILDGSGIAVPAWLCVCCPVDGAQFFFANRVGLSEVIEALSADVLAAQIEEVSKSVSAEFQVIGNTGPSGIPRLGSESAE